jgi:signal transduction histidine kinase
MTLPRFNWPIAGYLAVLVALALTAAFVAIVAIVIWLPPRPPDVMRADMVAAQFHAGYQHLVHTGELTQQSGMVWNVRSAPPRENEASNETRSTQAQLASMLSLRRDQVRLSATNVAQGDTFVFRVRDAEAIAQDAERVRRQVERANRAQHRIQIQRERMETERERAHSDRERVLAERERARAGHTPPVTPTPPLPPVPAVPPTPRIEIPAMDPLDPNFDEEAFEAQIEAQVEEAMREWEKFEFDPEDHEFHVQDIETPEAPAAPEAPEAPEAPDVVVNVPTVPVFAPAPPGVALISGFEVGAQLPDGRWLVMSQGRNWAELSWITRAILVIGGTLTVLSLLAILFARRLTRPIRNFSNAVQAVGVDPQSEPVQEEGPSELRGAARAVNTMQARLRSLIADRTKTLAAVAHDMRTPLMRLRLQAENVPPEMREKMAKEIEEVEALVAGFIAFARDDPAEEARVRLDLTALLQSITDDQAEAGRNVTFDQQEREIITGQSLGLKRLFSNLVENALKYGASARISLKREEGHVIIDIQDEGPGVPEDHRESVFEPFVRLQEGANGAGLGLPAARSIARAHGGDIVILDGAKGALLRVTLPG